MAAFFDIDNAKSYATEANLTKAIEKLGFADERYMVVCNRAGRFTAIFPASNVIGIAADPQIAGDATRYSRHGFMTVG